MSNSMKTMMICMLAATAILSMFLTFRFRSLRRQALISSEDKLQQRITMKMKIYTIFITIIFLSLIIMTAYCFITYMNN